MSNATSPIALHTLILESPRFAADQIQEAVRLRFPRTNVMHTHSIRQTQQLLQESAFDLVVLSLDPLRSDHATLLRALREHPTSMPTVLIASPDDEERIYEMEADLPSSWEIVHSETLTPELLARRINKAIHNHERHWELSHLEQAFRSSLIQYRSLFDEVPDLVFLCDRSGCLLDVNATATRLFNKPKDQLLMRPIFEAFGMRRDDFDCLLNHAQTHQGPIEDFELEFRPLGRDTIYGLTHLMRWQNGPGRPAQFQGVIKDISPHKRLERQLRQSQDRYKTLYDLARISSSSLRLSEVVEQSLDLIQSCCGATGTLLLLNRHYEELNLLAANGFPDELRQRMTEQGAPVVGQGLIGRLAITPGVHIIPDADATGLHPVIAEWMRGLGPCRLIGSTLGRGNPTLPTTILLLTMPPEQADALDEELLAGLSKTFEMGITNCFHYANSQEAETRYRELWDNAPAFFISILKGGIIFEINRTAAQALGYRISDLIGHPLTNIIPPEDHDLFLVRHTQLVEHGLPQDYEMRLIKADGETIIASMISEPLYDRHGVLVGEKSILHDITHDKELEARLRDYADNLERMVDARTTELTQTMNFLNGILEGSTEYAIVGLDERGRFLNFNRGAQLMFSYDAGQVVGARSFEILLDFANTPWPDLSGLLATVDSQGVLVEEVTMLTGDGRMLTALLTINRIKGQTASNLSYVAIMRDITEQKELEDLLKLYTENLQQVIEQKTRELDRQQVQLIQSSKLATLGEMATGIAHELNQPLSGIRTRAQLMNKMLERGKSEHERLVASQEEIIQLVDRVTRIINHMRIFARQDQQRFAPFKLTQSIEGALSLLGEQLRIHAIEVTQEIPANLPLVLGEPLQVEQVLLNLLGNARDALDARAEKEKADTETGHRYHKKLRLSASVRNDHELCLEVSDNGTGMSEDVRARIFDPFFTTKEVGRGTGLGLSISYGIITSHNGRFEVESQLGQGTTFRVYLPINDPASRATREIEPEDLVL